jgi:oxygen-independent coproporphyrinogen-3 oxidase
MKMKDDLVAALLMEIEKEKDFFQSPIDTIYFGGGTPSLLPSKDIELLLNTIKRTFNISTNPEITLEANPDDINKQLLEDYLKIGINRLSLGIQSFQQNDLEYMGRIHSNQEAEKALALIQDSDFENITMDLIFGTPGLSDEALIENLQKSIQYGVNHISAYGLTVEENTILFHKIRREKSSRPDDAQSARQFMIIHDFLSDKGFEHYEISNYAKKGHRSVHNSNYWKREKYLGLGPSAHSFNGVIRKWNVPNNARYIKSLKDDQTYYESEELTQVDRINEYIMLGLRTKTGINIIDFQNAFGKKSLNLLMENIAPFIQQNMVSSENGVISLTNKGMLYSDAIASELFDV